MKSLKYSKKAFSLTELLVILSIIGVIATIVIPMVVIKIQDGYLRESFKNNYYILGRAVDRVIDDKGGTLVGAFTTDTDFGNGFLNYMNPIKNCGDTITSCWHTASGWKYLDGTTAGILPPGTKAILNNGSLIVIDLLSSSCTDITYGPEVCGDIIVDVNGFKGPNVVGRDIYDMWILRNGIIPLGGMNDGQYCNSTSDGFGCAAKVIINQDY